MRLHQLLATVLVELRKTQLDVASRDIGTLAEQKPRNPAQRAPEAHHQRVRQEDEHPQQTDSQPSGPVARVQELRIQLAKH